MYRFQLISDLHLEFGACKKIKKYADYLILAGDIGYPEHELFKEFLQNASNTFKKVFYVTGNHEYYQNWKKGKNIKINSIDETNKIINDIINEVGHNVYFLNNSFHDLDDNLRIVGSTLWTNILPNSKSINDSYQIYFDEKTLINDEYINKLHKINLEFISEQIKNANDENKKLVLVTHHLPSYQLILEKYKTLFYLPYNSHFASDLDYLIKEPIKVWCAGHSHGFNHKLINGVECYINAYGYPNENRNGANLDFSFEIIE